MVSDSRVDECCDFFLENHVLVRDVWLKDALNYVTKEFPTHSGRRLYNALFEQWLYSDLKQSTYPTLESIDVEARKVDVHQPLILQITSLVDVGSSLLSQFNKLTYEFIDNTGFEMEQAEERHDHYQAKPSRCLMLSLSDGVREVKAMERRPIVALSLLTAPGCKVLLRPPLVARKGIFLLSASNVQVLGGDDAVLMETGRPLVVMARTLNKELPARRDSTHINHTESTLIDEGRMFEEMEQEYDLADFEPVPAVAVVRPLSTVSARPSPLTAAVQATPSSASVPPCAVHRRALTVAAVPVLAAGSPTPPTRRAPRRIICAAAPATSSPQVRDGVQRSSVLNAGTESGGSNRSLREVKERVEVIDLEVDEDMKPCTSTTIDEPSSSEVNVDEAERFVIAYRSLRLLTIAEARKQSKFQTGRMIRKIEAFVGQFVEALRIVDGMWTMKLLLKDESDDGTECVLHASVLEKLIGLTVDEAMAIRSSSDVARKKEGMSRLKATEEILGRLDLIWTVELYPARSNVTPIVTDVQTLAEILHVFD